MHIFSIDILRGFAALAVVWYHFICGKEGFIGKGPVLSSGELGWLGYEVFFIISGFVVPYSLHLARYTLKNYHRFIGKRIVRLQLPYIASVLLILLSNYIMSRSGLHHGEPFRYDPVDLLTHVFYLNDILGKPWLNAVYWTLALEFQFYIVIGGLYALIANPGKLVRYVCYALMLLSYFALGSDQKFLFSYMPLFMLGMAAFQKKAGIISKKEFALMTIPLICVVWSFHPLMPLISCVVVVFILRARADWKAGILLGEISYSLYLTHVPVGGRIISLASGSADSFGEKMLAVLAALCLSIAAAALFYKLIEAPAMVLSKKIKYR